MPAGKHLHCLVTMTGPPVHLETNRVYTLGRGPDCEIVVSDVQCSRRHAELRFDMDRFVLVDLGSRNGTYVGGKRIREKTLRNGDKFRIGAQTFSYIIRTEDQTTDELAGVGREAQMNETLAASELLQEQEDGGIMGSLAQFSLPELIQFLHSGTRSGMLEIHAEPGTGRFWFDNGTLVDGELNEVRGEEALLQLATQAGGFFSFQPSGAATLRSKTITRPTPMILLEVCRILDEQAAELGNRADSSNAIGNAQ